MRINLENLDKDNFVIREGEIAGEICYLVFPQHIGCKWTKSNLFLRSSIWNKDGDLISASFPKFFNWGEKPELGHTPFSASANGGINAIEKMDGSTLIVSKYRGELITRTRGTFKAQALDTGSEIEYLIEKYPKAFDLITDEKGTSNYSLLFEWVTPNNVIVLNYGEHPDIVLIGKINHEDYSLETQEGLDNLAQELNVKRPKRYHYDKISEMLEDVKQWEGTEGICCYSKKDQSIRKIKSEWYLTLHRMKSELGSFGRIVDAFFVMNMPDYNDFYNQIGTVYDWEIAEKCKPHISIICDGWKEVSRIVKGMVDFVDFKVKLLNNRKDQALAIKSAYGETNRAGFVFSLLDGKELNKDQLKKLLYQTTKQN